MIATASIESNRLRWEAGLAASAMNPIGIYTNIAVGYKVSAHLCNQFNLWMF